MSPRQRPNRGFTLVEVIVAMAIILFVTMACVQILQSNARASLANLKRIEAHQYLHQIHNHLRRSNISKLDEHYLHFPQIVTDKEFSAEATIQPVASDESRQATLTVRWTSGSSVNSISEDVTLASQ